MSNISKIANGYNMRRTFIVESTNNKPLGNFLSCVLQPSSSTMHSSQTNKVYITTNYQTSKIDSRHRVKESLSMNE
jgi:hypothetical protein